MSRPKILDGFCKGGGAGYGLYLAGFDVVGVDIEPQKNYPAFHNAEYAKHFEFRQIDFFDVDLSEFDAVWASPPCQYYSTCVNPKGGTARRLENSNLIPDTRTKIGKWSVPYIIENVPNAPLVDFIKLDGTMFGLPTFKERWFECSGFEIPFMQLPTPYKKTGQVARGEFAGIMRHGKDSIEKTKREDLAEAYQIHWHMTREELREAIPPVYAEYLGNQLIQVL